MHDLGGNLIAWGLLLVVLPLAIGTYLLGKHAKLSREWTRRKAEVVSERWSSVGMSDGTGSALKAVTIRWVDDAGRDHFFTNPIQHSGAGFLKRVPSPVDVYVDPANPNRGILARGIGSYRGVGVLVLALPTLVVLVAGYLIL